MSLLAPSTATATVAANTNSVSITALDLTTVYPGMTINFGGRDRKVGDAWILATVAANGSSGGTLTTVGAIPTAYTNAPFVIDTLGYLGTDASYAAATSLSLLSTLLTLFGPNTVLYTGDRKLALDKKSSAAVGRVVASIAGRTWADIDHRTISYTPTGGSATSGEAYALRAYPDGTTPVDALLVDLATGGCDVRKAAVTMASAVTTDLGSAPFGKVAITGSASITSFGPGKHLHRLVHIVDGGAVLAYNATSLILPGRANILTQPGDCFEATSDASGNWRVRDYNRASGKTLIGPAAADISDASASGRSLITAGDYAAMRAQLSLTIGTNVQAWDGDLDAIAGLATQAFGRGLLTAGDASGARGLLGLPIGAITAYNPTVTPQTGAFGSLGSVSGFYQRINARLIYITIDIAIANNGTGGGFLVNATLPFPAGGTYYALAGRENASTGKQLQAIIAANAPALGIFNYDNSYPGGNGYRLIVSGIYEAAP